MITVSDRPVLPEEFTREVEDLAGGDVDDLYVRLAYSEQLTALRRGRTALNHGAFADSLVANAGVPEDVRDEVAHLYRLNISAARTRAADSK